MYLGQTLPIKVCGRGNFGGGVGDCSSSKNRRRSRWEDMVFSIKVMRVLSGNAMAEQSSRGELSGETSDGGVESTGAAKTALCGSAGLRLELGALDHGAVQDETLQMQNCATKKLFP